MATTHGSDPKIIIHRYTKMVTQDCLKGKSYEADQVSNWCYQISSNLISKLNEVFERYKFLATTYIKHKGDSALFMNSAC